MGDSKDTFEASAGAKLMFPKVADGVEDAAIKMVGDFADLGMGTQESCSLVAHILLRTAWKIAGTGRLSIGEEPDQERFMAICDDVTKSIRWKMPPARTEEKTDD